MPHIPDINEIRQLQREVLQELRDELASELARVVGHAQPGLFDREHLPHEHAAAYLGISSPQLKKLRQAGLIEPAFVDGHAYYYRREDLDRYMAGERGKLNDRAA